MAPEELGDVDLALPPDGWQRHLPPKLGARFNEIPSLGRFWGRWNHRYLLRRESLPSVSHSRLKLASVICEHSSVS